jgi:hypothetical protein
MKRKNYVIEIINKKSKDNNMGFFHWLTLTLIILKFTNFIDWGWWLIFSPLVIFILVDMLITTLHRSPSFKIFNILDWMEKNKYK